MTARPWTADEDARIRTLWGQGRTVAQIASQVPGRSLQMIRRRIRRDLRLSRRYRVGGQIWNDFVGKGRDRL